MRQIYEHRVINFIERKPNVVVILWHFNLHELLAKTSSESLVWDRFARFMSTIVVFGRIGSTLSICTVLRQSYASQNLTLCMPKDSLNLISKINSLILIILN